MKELDVVRLKESFGGLPAGTEGTVVLEYDGSCFEVEFFDAAGNTVGVLTTPAGMLEAVPDVEAAETKENEPQNDYTFYAGFEGETEIILYLGEDQVYHIWKGYFDDIFDTPSLDGDGWTGFTRDYHQLEGAFSLDAGTVEIDPEEYLADLMRYKDKVFDFGETSGVFKLMVSMLEKAKAESVVVKIDEA